MTLAKHPTKKKATLRTCREIAVINPSMTAAATMMALQVKIQPQTILALIMMKMSHLHHLARNMIRNLSKKAQRAQKAKKSRRKRAHGTR